MRLSAFVHLAVLCPFLLFSVTAAQAEPASCRSGQLRNEDQHQANLLRQSVEIIRRAERGEIGRLRSVVPASAKFVLGVHDVLSAWNGPEGAIEFAKYMGASEFEAVNLDTGPAPPANLCGDHEVTLWLLWLSRSDGAQGYQVTFRYDDGELTQASAQTMVLTKGKIDPR